MVTFVASREGRTNRAATHAQTQSTGQGDQQHPKHCVNYPSPGVARPSGVAAVARVRPPSGVGGGTRQPQVERADVLLAVNGGVGGAVNDARVEESAVLGARHQRPATNRKHACIHHSSLAAQQLDSNQADTDKKPTGTAP